jgi:hypothetical protein
MIHCYTYPILLLGGGVNLSLGLISQLNFVMVCMYGKTHIKYKIWGRMLVAYTCNPSYSKGRDQEDSGSKPAQESSLSDPILKILNTKKGQRGRAPA